MTLKDVWIDKVDGESEVVSNDINTIAHSVIELENAVPLKADTTYVNEQLETKADDADYQEFKNSTSTIISITTQQTIPQLDAKKADISYVDNAISSAIGQALEANY